MKKEENIRNAKLKLLAEYEKMADECEQAKRLPKEIEQEKKELAAIEEQLRELFKGRFEDVEINSFEDFGEECNTAFDHLIAHENNVRKRALLEAKEVMEKADKAEKNASLKRKAPEDEAEER